MAEPLEGVELLAKLKQLPKDIGKTDKAIACGYATESGRVRLTAFYAALLAAGGVNLEPDRAKPRAGRKLSYVTSRLTQGHCVVGARYLEAAGIEPKAALEIKATKGRIVLTAAAA